MNKLIFALFLLTSASANAQLYKCMKDGKMVVGDQPCAKGDTDLAPKKLTVPPQPKPVEVESESPTLVFHECSYGKSLKKCLPDHPVKLSVKDNAVAMCQAHIKGSLKDPSSAIFSKQLRGVPDTIKGQQVRYYWVDVNAKNSFGGYTGAQTFACLMNAEETIVLHSGKDIDMVAITDPIPNLTR